MTKTFTAENAAEFGRRGGLAAAKAKAERDQIEKMEREAMLQMPVSADEQARTKRVMRQIERCDELLEECEADEFPALTAAKERLWNLIFPKAGVRRPAKDGNRKQAPQVQQVA